MESVNYRKKKYMRVLSTELPVKMKTEEKNPEKNINSGKNKNIQTPLCF